MPRSAHPRIVAAFGPLVEHLAYARPVERQEDRVVPLGDLLPEAGAELTTAVKGARASKLPVQLLDLHGLRARDARAALDTCTEPVCVVWFGKGTGALREVFLEFLDRRPDLVVVDLAGETAARPQESMGVVVRGDLHDRLLAALDRGGASSARTPKARRPTAPPAPTSWWGRLLGWVLRLFGGRR